MPGLRYPPDSVLTQTILDVETVEVFCPSAGWSEADAGLPGASSGASLGEVDAVETVDFFERF